MKRKEFMQNAVIMTLTSFLLRTIGIFFRIYLSNVIGAEGMGLYQLVFSIYVLGSTFASAGISTAVARLITDELVCGTTVSVKKILRKAVLLSALIGIASAAIISGFSSPIGNFFVQDIRAVPSLQILGFSLPFMGISSCLRGYFMARRKTLLPSLAQIAEQLIRIVLICFFLQLFKGMDITYACFAVICGDSIAEILSCIIISIGYYVDQKHLSVIPTNTNCTPYKKGVLHRIMAIAAPITTGRYLNSGLRTIENILVPNQLAVYSGSDSSGLSQFGMLKGMALPLLFFPASFLSSISTLLIPELSEAHTLKQKRTVNRAVTRTLQITLWSSVLLSGLFTFFAYDLGEVLYKSADVGFLLRVLSPLMPVMYLESIVDGMLKGLNQQVSSLWYSILDSASRILLIIVLVPKKGMGGFLLIMIISNILTSYLNLHRLLQVTGVRMCWGAWIIKPTIAVSVSAGITFFALRLAPHIAVNSVFYMVIGSVFISISYTLLSFMMGILKKEDLRNLKLHRSRKAIALPEGF